MAEPNQPLPVLEDDLVIEEHTSLDDGVLDMAVEVSEEEEELSERFVLKKRCGKLSTLSRAIRFGWHIFSNMLWRIMVRSLGWLQIARLGGLVPMT